VAFVPYTSIQLFPTPDSAYTLNAVVPVQPRQGASVIADELMLRYDQAICDGALAWLVKMPARPWTNPQLAPGLEANFLAGVSGARADVMRSFNAGGTTARRRAFIV
jgi:hypothetical protein